MNKMVKDAIGGGGYEVAALVKKRRSKKGRSSAGSFRSGASSRASKSSTRPPGQRKHGDKLSQDEDSSIDRSASYKKLLGYISHPSKSRRKSGRKPHQPSSSKEQDPRGPEKAGPHRKSGKKKPKYHSSKSASKTVQHDEFGTSYRTVSTNTSQSVSSNRVGTSPSGGGKKNKLRWSMEEDNMYNMHVLEEEPSKIGAPGEIRAPGGYSSKCKSAGDCPGVSNSAPNPSSIRRRSSARSVNSGEFFGNGPPSAYSSVYDDLQPQSVCLGSSLYSSVYDRIQESKKGLAVNRSVDKRNGVATQAVDLPWMDNASAGRLQGLYSGTAVIRPHGEGTLVLDSVDGNVLTFTGRWVDGKLVTPLTKVDGKKDGVASSEAGSRRFSALQEYKKKHSYSSDNLARNYGSANPKYSLGEVARSPGHMVIHQSNDQATRSASLLHVHELAFLKRSTGVWYVAPQWYIHASDFQLRSSPYGTTGLYNSTLRYNSLILESRFNNFFPPNFISPSQDVRLPRR